MEASYVDYGGCTKQQKYSLIHGSKSLQEEMGMFVTTSKTNIIFQLFAYMIFNFATQGYYKMHV